MKIMRAVGLGLLIITLKFLVPRIFAGIENTLLSFFDTLQFALGTTKGAMQAGGSFLPAHIPGVGLAR
jgi:hypothetical protein